LNTDFGNLNSAPFHCIEVQGLATQTSKLGMKQIVNNFSTQRCKKWKGNEKKTLVSANKIKVMSQNFLLYIWTSFWKPYWPEGYDTIHSILTALSLSLKLTPGIQQRTLIVDRQFLIVVTNLYRSSRGA
jgi:hypothetical protein